MFGLRKKKPLYNDQSRHFTLPRLADPLSATLRSQLRGAVWITRLLSVATAVVLPVADGILVNKEQWWCLIYVGCAHAILSLALILTAQPLPAFLIEFDEQAEKLRKSEAEAEAHHQFASAFHTATLAARDCLVAIHSRGQGQSSDTLEQVLEEIMQFWVAGRSEIFNFDGSALHSFAVYVYHPGDNRLKLAWRSCDDRIPRTDREWEPGKGHVGLCYSQGEAIFSADASSDKPLLCAGTRPEDDNYYRTIVAAPFAARQDCRGVFVVTSSKPRQMEETVHKTIVQLVTALIEHGIRDCVPKSWRQARS